MRQVDKFVEFKTANRVVKERKGGGTVGVQFVVKDELGQDMAISMDFRNFFVLLQESLELLDQEHLVRLERDIAIAHSRHSQQTKDN